MKMLLQFLLHVSMALLSIGLAVGCSTMPASSPRDLARTSFDVLRSEVRSVISGDERQDQLLRIIDELEQLAFEAADEKSAVMERISKLNADYTSTQEQFDEVLGAFRESQKARHVRFIEAYKQARAITTDEEWKLVGKIKQEALERALETGQAAEVRP